MFGGGLDWLFGGERGDWLLIGGLDWLFGGQSGIGCLVVKEGWVVWW